MASSNSKLPVITANDIVVVVPPAAVSFTTHLTTKALRGHLFALSQYARRVSDVTQEDAIAPSSFHSVSEPPIDLAEYVIGAAIKCRLDKVTVLLSFAYVGAHSRAAGRHPSILSVHRMCAAALFHATKVMQPSQASAPMVFATAVRLPVEELHELTASLSLKGCPEPSGPMLEELFRKMESARGKSLRREIAAAVGLALDLPALVPQPSPDRHQNSDMLSPTTQALSFNAGANSFLQAPVEWGLSAPPSPSLSPLAFGSSPMASLRNSPCPRHLAGSGLGLVRLLREDLFQSQQLQLPNSASGGCYSLPTFESEFDEDELVLPPVQVVVVSPPPNPPTSAARRHRSITISRY